jgi:hypothetical protein
MQMIKHNTTFMRSLSIPSLEIAMLFRIGDS